MSRRRGLALAGGVMVLALASGVNLAGIDDLPFYTKGEPREALVVWEMAHGGGLVLPLRNGDEVPSKPPMFHWLGLLSSQAIGGVSELSTRLPSAALAIALTLGVYAFAAATSRIRSGWLAAATLATSFEWLRAARTARVDMTFTFFFAGALLLYATTIRSGATRPRVFAFWAALAGATLAKGPVGLVLPLLVVIAYRASSSPASTVAPAPNAWGDRAALDPGPPPWVGAWRRVRDGLRDLRAPQGLAGAIGIAGLWYAGAWASGGEDFLQTHLLRENVFRVLDAERFGSGHAHGPLYLVGQFFLGAFPWSLSAPAIAWWLWRRRPLDETDRFLVVWFLVVFGFFLLPESKRGVYLLPAYPAAALLFGRVLGPGPEGEAPRRLAAIGWCLGCAVLGLLAAAALLVASGLPAERLVLPHLRPHEASEVIDALATLRSDRVRTALAGVVALGAASAAAWNAAGAHWLRASLPRVLALVVVLGALVAPVERTIARRRSYAPFLAEVKARIAGDSLAFAEGTFDYGAVFYAGRHIPRDTASRRQARWLLAFERGGSLPPRTEEALRSRGTGVHGRTPLILLRRRARTAVQAPDRARR